MNASFDTSTNAERVLSAAKTLRCTFPTGEVANVDDPTRTRTSPVPDVTFDSIDRPNQKARLIAENGAADVFVIPGHTAVTFIEISDSGNPHITVVFPKFRPGTRKFLAVDSQFTMIPLTGEAFTGHYYGDCAVLQ